MFQQKNDKINDRQRRQISFISQFTTWIEHISGENNVVADFLSRIETIITPTSFNIEDLALAQSQDDELSKFVLSKNTGLKLKKINFGTEKVPIVCDIYDDIFRPFVPLALRKSVFDMYHNSSHPGIKATHRLIQRKFVWPFMHKDIAKWARSCVRCLQR